MNKSLQLLRIASLILADDRIITPEVAKDMFLQYKKEHPNTEFRNEYDLAESQGYIIRDIDKKPQVEDIASDTVNKVQKELLDKQYFDAIKNNDMNTVHKMVDEAAKKVGYDTGPVWHGTKQEGFTEFVESEIGTGGEAGERKSGAWGRGFYFSGEPVVADAYGHNRIAAYLSIRNPIVLDFTVRPSKWTSADAKRYRSMTGIGQETIKATQWAQERGYDGVILYDDIYNDGGRIAAEIVAFSPTQIKSADTITNDDEGNVIPLSQRFNKKNDDIRY